MFKLFFGVFCCLLCFGTLANAVKEDVEKILSGHLTSNQSRGLMDKLERNLPYPSVLDTARVKTVKCWFYDPQNDKNHIALNDLLSDANQAIKKADSPKLKLDLQTCQAFNLYQQGKVSAATSMTKNVISDTSKNPELYYQHATANLILGRIFRSQGSYQQAFLAFQQAYNSFEQGGFSYDKALILKEIGLIHADLHNFLLAEEQLQRAINELTNYNEQEWYIATDILAQAYEAQGNYQKAIMLYNSILPAVTKYEDDEGSAYLLFKIAQINIQLNELQEAKQYLNQARDLTLNSEWIKFIQSITTAEWLIKKGRLDEAELLYLDFEQNSSQVWSVDSLTRFLEFKRELAVQKSNYQQEALAQRELLKIADKKVQEIADNTLLSQRLAFDWDQQKREITRLKESSEVKEQLLNLANEKAFWQIASLLFSIGLILILAYITYKQTQHKQRFKTLALKDELTDIANRRAIFAFKYNAIKKSEFLGSACSLIVIDIDHFKQVNDTYGHDIGDEVIISTVKFIEKNIRQTDCAGRVGGEEFLVVLPNTALSFAHEVAQRIRENIENVTHTSLHIKSTVSIGVVEVKAGEAPKDASRRADEKLYAAKNAGRNKVMV